MFSDFLRFPNVLVPPSLPTVHFFLPSSLFLVVRFLFFPCFLPLLYDFISVPLLSCSLLLFYVSLSYIWLGEVKCVFVFWLILHFLHHWIL